MTKKPDHIANAGKAIDFDRDGLCMADIEQEKTCKNFESLAYSGMCVNQGIGFACEYEERKDD